MPHSTLTRMTATLLLAGTACVSHATVITFDERPWVFGPFEYAFWSNPIDGWYDSLGVDFGTAYLQPADPLSNFPGSQYILGPNGYSFSFTGTLPRYVSLEISSPFYDFRSEVTALDAAGHVVGSANTGGQYLDGNGNWLSTPFKPRSVASFHSEAGISRLEFFTNPGGQRLEAAFDNLYFGNVAAVPEPAAMALWAAGLGVIGAAARRRRPVA